MFTEVLSFSSISRINDEDLCSQLNYVWSALVIAIMGTLISFVQFVGNPIECWCPAHMPQHHCNYTKALCWVKENYYVHVDKMIEVKEDDRYNITVAYYPWVPWILFFMAAMLNLPHILWQSFVSSSGLNVSKLITLAELNENLDSLAKILRVWLHRNRKIHKNWISSVYKFLGSIGFFWLGKNHRTYLCGLAILVKLAYLVVCIGLFLGMNIFIDEHFVSYGFEVLDDYFKGIPRTSVRFPKQTLCDMKIRQMANIHTYSIQCILPINMYNEKIFLFLWFWYIVLISINSYSLLKWCLHLLSPSNRRKFVKQYVIILFHLLERKKEKERERNGDFPIAEDGGAEPEAVPLTHNMPSTPIGPRERPINRVRNAIRDVFSGNGLRSRRGRYRVSIETDERELEYVKRKREINRITTRMLKHFGHDGIVVFRTLEDSVGIVIANQIFQELYEQSEAAYHYS